MFDVQPLLPMFENAAPAAPARRPRARPAASVPPKPSGAGELRVERQAFLGLASCWDLSGPEALQLLGEPLATEAERHERLQALLGIRRSLQLLAADNDVAGLSQIVIFRPVGTLLHSVGFRGLSPHRQRSLDATAYKTER